MKNAQQGATLTELLVVTAIMALVLGALVPLLSIGQQTWDVADRHADMIQNARRALDKLIRDLRAAQNFQTVSPTLVRFRMARGDGTGATPTVEYQLNAVSGEIEYRTSADFAYRRRITVTNPLLALFGVPAGYAVSVVFDHAALVAGGRSLASGNDVRILYWNGTKWIELDRFKDIPTAWNSTTTRLWFKLQAPIPLLGSDNNYYLHYGDLSASSPPANGDYVFLDYEDGTSLADWTRRDACAGTSAASGAGFIFTAGTGSCHRQLSKSVPHSNVEVFWEFWSSAAGAGDGHQAGVSARRSNTGVGYVVTLADEVNTTLRIRYWTTWSTTGGAIGSVPASISANTSYYGRFYLVGSNLRVKYWVVGTAEPGWMLTVTHSGAASGNHYGQVDGFAAPIDHRHRNLIIRPRVDPEPTAALAAEENGARADVPQPLAGPFRSMGVQCFDAAGTVIGCGTSSAVKSVQVTLTVMDPTGQVADVVVTARAYRQAP